ncbi:MAG: Asp-tRNA(Asn)/Glu-tRNA(Gln) amidotransferase subunit GatC [Candidatus Latescibacteria bacterium]|jgi:aspartyl-tRNA(Asn)/glutamyl-tRNA(Gln) amidotransferase subunit C|nr:Asp-tRNA(Asn)/Glu-tRNA(Gln) amidotransferase subunit GatC [Candidatus Latescibacterota bacterium]MBT4140704.1 Asp-tRNA(Asn)/Glu-tRNA(Gln) amidotransferase subunit GatC [Candidatus Latescibacterota bacterium]MBT5829771.1 Asp-tRNA(Asn)/Glu-tRNA(Gln) amidotransferase subunit GatC [Candidatus Latescibacterota bacterium]
MPVSKVDVQKVAELARLSFSSDEEDLLVDELNRMLDYVAVLDALDTTGVSPTAHVLPLENAFRSDVLGQSLTQEDALANAPLSGQGHFRVPRVIE